MEKTDCKSIERHSLLSGYTCTIADCFFSKIGMLRCIVTSLPAAMIHCIFVFVRINPFSGFRIKPDDAAHRSVLLDEMPRRHQSMFHGNRPETGVLGDLTGPIKERQAHKSPDVRGSRAVLLWSGVLTGIRIVECADEISVRVEAPCKIVCREECPVSGRSAPGHVKIGDRCRHKENSTAVIHCL